MAIEDTEVPCRFAIGRSASRSHDSAVSRLLELRRTRRQSSSASDDTRSAVKVSVSAGLHQAASNDASAVARRIGSVRRRRPVDQRERRLQRIDASDRLAARQQVDAEIRHADRAHLAFLDGCHRAQESSTGVPPSSGQWN